MPIGPKNREINTKYTCSSEKNLEYFRPGRGRSWTTTAEQVGRFRHESPLSLKVMGIWGKKRLGLRNLRGVFYRFPFSGCCAWMDEWFWVWGLFCVSSLRRYEGWMYIDFASQMFRTRFRGVIELIESYLLGSIELISNQMGSWIEEGVGWNCSRCT